MGEAAASAGSTERAEYLMMGAGARAARLGVMGESEEGRNKQGQRMGWRMEWRMGGKLERWGEEEEGDDDDDNGGRLGRVAMAMGSSYQRPEADPPL